MDRCYIGYLVGSYTRLPPPLDLRDVKVAKPLISIGCVMFFLAVIVFNDHLFILYFMNFFGGGAIIKESEHPSGGGCAD